MTLGAPLPAFGFGMGGMPSTAERPLILDESIDGALVTLVYRRNAQQGLVLTGHSGMRCGFCGRDVAPESSAVVVFGDIPGDDVRIVFEGLLWRVGLLRSIGLMPAAIGAHTECAMTRLPLCFGLIDDAPLIVPVA